MGTTNDDRDRLLRDRGLVKTQVAKSLLAERELIRLYEKWPARRDTNGVGRLRAFFAWLKTERPRLTEYGLFGHSTPYQHVSAITGRWEATYGRVERIRSR